MIINLVTIALNFFKDCYHNGFSEATEILSPSWKENCAKTKTPILPSLISGEGALPLKAHVVS